MHLKILKGSVCSSGRSLESRSHREKIGECSSTMVDRNFSFEFETHFCARPVNSIRFWAVSDRIKTLRERSRNEKFDLGEWGCKRVPK